MKDSTRAVFDYLKKMKDKNVTAAEVADATGLTKKQVDGIFTAAIQRKGFGSRVPAQVKNDDGNYIIKLFSNIHPNPFLYVIIGMIIRYDNIIVIILALLFYAF